VNRAIVVVALVLAGACAKSEEKTAADVPPAPIPVEERDRTVEACARYVEQICACSAAKPDRTDLAEACTLDKMLPGALRIAIETAENPTTQKKDALLARGQVTKLATSCFERTAKLPALGCAAAPTPTPAPAPATP
jgi:hypothetical protein